MARRPRDDRPGAWFHVVNRGIARRTLFEHAGDMNEFLDHLEAACEREEIEVHAFTLLTTHYHMLVRSPNAELANAMQRIQTEYSRWFNRSRRRDGPLVRGRYTSKRVRTDYYRRNVVRYIDRNPVAAGLVTRAADHPYGSARSYVMGPPGPFPGLARSWVESEVCRQLGLHQYAGSRYHEVFGMLPEGLARLVELRLGSRDDDDPLENLIDAAPTTVLEWMRRKAMLADGTRPGLPVATPESVADAVRDLRQSDPSWTLGRRDGWQILQIGLLRQLCGTGLAELARRSGCSIAAVHRVCATHGARLESDDAYAELAASVTRRALDVWVAADHRGCEAAVEARRK